MPVENTQDITITDEQRAQAFGEEYKALTEKYGFEFIPVPQFAPTNHGTFEIGVQLGIRPIEKPQGTM